MHGTIMNTTRVIHLSGQKPAMARRSLTMDDMRGTTHQNRIIRDYVKMSRLKAQ